jgi:hypothetical protein
MRPTDTCAWCGDYRRQHDEKGCNICGRQPWERGPYRCTAFVEPDEIDNRRRAFMRDLEKARKGALS